MTPMQQVRARCEEVVQLAKKLYGIDLSAVQISFNLKGRAAGKAGGRMRQDPNLSNYYVKFNHDMLTREAMEHILQDTVPHEYAHILGYIDPMRFGSNHCYTWARITRELGGSGKRFHQEEVVYGTGTTYEYTTDRGHKVRLSSRHHNLVQSGRSLRYNGGKGVVSKTCAYSIVGHQGRTLSAPIVKKAVADTPPNTPAKIESFRSLAPVVPAYTGGGREEIERLLTRVTAQKTVAPMTQSGLSKAAMARAIMLSGHKEGKSYEEIITAIMHATGHDRQLSRSYYKGNYAKVGCPAP